MKRLSVQMEAIEKAKRQEVAHCRFCGRTFNVSKGVCAVCQHKMDIGASLTVKYLTPVMQIRRQLS